MTPTQAARLVKKHGSIKAAARASKKEGGEGYTTIRTAYRQAVAVGKAPKRTSADNGEGAASIGKIPMSDGSSRRAKLPKGYLKPKKAKRLGTGQKRYHIFTCAQNNTKVHPQFWVNVEAFAAHMGASIHVARLTYFKTASKSNQNKTDSLYTGQDTWWADEVQPYLDDTRLEVAPYLRWCGDMDIIPTAADPLSGLQNYTGRSSAIFPHTSIALQGVPGAKTDPTKLIMTTGTVTLRNYIQRKTGMKADFHHCYAFTFIEVDEAGYWFPFQCNADSTGTFYHADLQVKDGKVTSGHRLEAIYWADPQIVEEDPELIDLAYGKGGIKDTLRPKHDFMGDVGSFKSRSHWDQKDAYKRFLRTLQGLGDVRKEGEQIAAFLTKAGRAYCETHILDGNHERHIGRWLRENNGMFDPVNAEIWVALQTRVLAYIRVNHDEPNFLEVLMDEVFPPGFSVDWLHRDESFILCKDAGGGIECGAHGDDGTHGGRGSTTTFAKTGRKMCLGHAWPEIKHGIYRASSRSRPNLDWCHGPTAMNNCADIWIYANGKRSLSFTFAGKWRA